MNEELSEFDPVDEAAEEFVQRYRRGERPSLTEYVRKYPAVAGKIRALFPALVAMEELGRAEPPSATPGLNQEGAIPQQLGDYRIVREIARGGMGVVYEAVQQSLGRHVALKVLPYQGGLSANQLERFQREARAAARLHHTNIVPVFGVGEHQGIHYFAMQFIQGQSLDHVLQEVKRLRNQGKPEASAPGDYTTLATEVAGKLMTGRFRQHGAATEEATAERADGSAERGARGLDKTPSAPDSAHAALRSALRAPHSSDSTSTILSHPAGSYYRSVAQIGLQVAEALDYAHQQGVLHRDIKPSNLILDTKGTVWITDFGLAKADGEDLTRAGDIVGTLRYMSPERFHGQADPRSDIYSLGLTLYEMIALRPAFASSEKAQLVENILHQEPAPVRKGDPRTPRDLETIILKAIAKERARRYKTAAEMSEDLRRFLADRPVHARRTRMFERTWRWCRRNPLVASLAGAVAALLVTVALVASLLAWNLREEEAATRDQLQLTREAQQEGRQRLFRTLVEQARASRLSGRMGRRFRSLAILDEAAKMARELKSPDKDFFELRNETIACLALLDLRIDKEWAGLPVPNSSVHFDRDFRFYARGDSSGDISVRRVAGDVEIHHIPSGRRLPGVRLSPHGRYLAASWDRGARYLKVWKLAGPTPDLVLEEPSQQSYDFNPAGEQMAIAHSNGSIHFVELSSGRRRQLRVPPSLLSVTFHPTKPQLAVAYRQNVQILHLETEKIIGTIPVTDLERWVAWHPDGKTLATNGVDRNIYLWDAASGRQIARLEGHKHVAVVMGFDPSGDLLASRSLDVTLRFWDPRTGRQLFVTQARWHPFCHFSGDGRLLGPDLDLEKGRLKLWEVASPRGYRTLVRDPAWGKENYRQFAIDPEGRLLVAGMPDGLAFWDLPTGRPLKFLPVGNANPGVFQRSGDLLASRQDGVYRFSIRPDSTIPGSLRIAVEKKLPLPGPASLAASPDGRVVAAALTWDAQVWHRDLSDAPIHLSHEDVLSIAVSPNRDWVATGSWGASLETRIWEAKSGRLVKSLPGGSVNQVAFSPNGQWLAAGGGGLRLWKVPSWQEGPRIGGSVFAFSHDGNILAVETGWGAVRLLDPATGAEFARLEDPDQDRAIWLGFSPDGSRLIVNGEGQALHMWDLRAIGQQLAQRNLPWNLPLPPTGEPEDTNPKRQRGSPPGPLELTVDPSVLAMMNLVDRALGQLRQGRWDNALCLYSLAIELDPKNAQAHNGLAWLRATCPDARIQNVTQAAELAKRAVTLAPQDGNIWNSLGVAEYRMGNWRAAIEALNKSVELQHGKEPRDFFFLAMAYWKLDEKELARKCYSLAVQSRTRPDLHEEELLRLRAEAADLLGVFVPPGLPAAKDDVAYYTCCLDLVPNAEWARHQRALAYGAQGDWGKAAVDFSEFLRASAQPPTPWCEYAAVLLLKEDHGVYRGLCQSVLKRFGASQDPVELYLLARILSLAPHDIAKPVEAVERAKKAVTAHPDWAWFRHTAAVAHYRAGQFDLALEQAEKGVEVDPDWGGHVVNWLLLAMIHEKLRHHDDARQWLDKSLQWFDESRRKLPRDTPFSLPLPSWADRLEAELLRREARALISEH